MLGSELMSKWYAEGLGYKPNNNFYRGLCSLFMFSPVSISEYMDNRVVQIVRVAQWAKEGFAGYAELGIQFDALPFVINGIASDIKNGKNEALDWGLTESHFAIMKHIIESGIITTLVDIRLALRKGA